MKVKIDLVMMKMKTKTNISQDTVDLSILMKVETEEEGEVEVVEEAEEVGIEAETLNTINKDNGIMIENLLTVKERRILFLKIMNRLKFLMIIDLCIIFH